MNWVQNAPLQISPLLVLSCLLFTSLLTISGLTCVPSRLSNNGIHDVKFLIKQSAWIKWKNSYLFFLLSTYGKQSTCLPSSLTLSTYLSFIMTRAAWYARNKKIMLLLFWQIIWLQSWFTMSWNDPFGSQFQLSLKTLIHSGWRECCSVTHFTFIRKLQPPAVWFNIFG